MLTTRRTKWMKIESIAALALLGGGAIACSSSNGGPTPSKGTSDAAASSAPAASDAAMNVETGTGTLASDAATTVEAGTGAPPADAGSVTLTVMNFLKWCSVTINGNAPSTAASVSASVPPGTTTIVAMPASSAFMIGADPWFGVTENGGGAAAGTDNGTGATETTTATVVVTRNTCVSVCCQLPGNSPTPCPTTNPCP